MEPLTFQVTRPYRPRRGAIAAGVAVTLACVAATVFARGSIPPVVLPAGCVVLSIGYALASIAIGPGRASAIGVAHGLVTTSWHAAPIRPSEVTIGRWVLPSVNAPVGFVAHIRSPDGELRVGTRDPLAGPYARTGRSVQYVDCQLRGPEFGAFLQALGIAPPPPAAVPTFELVERRGPVAMMLPWFATMAVASGVGLPLSLLGLPPVAATAIVGAVIVAGMIVTVGRAAGVREPECALRIEADGLVFARSSGAAIARAPWSEVVALRARGVVYQKGRSFVYPTLAIAMGKRTIVVGLWDQTRLWADAVKPARRHAGWLASPAEWGPLVYAFQARGCLR